MNILTAALANYVAWLLAVPFLAPFYVRTLGPACVAELCRTAAVSLYLGMLMWSILYALGECQELLSECRPVLLGALYHRFRPGVACPNWNCPRCWETRGVVLGRSALFQEDGN